MLLANIEIAVCEPGSLTGLAKPRSMILAVTVPPFLGTRHDVTRFDIPMNQLLFVYRSQPGGDLPGDGPAPTLSPGDRSV